MNTTATRIALSLLAVALCAQRVRGDALPPNVTTLGYEWRIENLSEYQKSYAFILYPTSNSGFGYVLEEGVPLNGVMMSGRHGMTTRLYAMTRAALRKHDPDAERVPHGDDGQMVLVVDEPPKSTPVAAAEIHPPGPVPLADPRWKVSRTFRIAKVTPSQLVLELVEEVTQLRDGTRHVRTGKGETRTEPAPPDWKPPPAPKSFDDVFKGLIAEARGGTGGKAVDPLAAPEPQAAPSAPTPAAPAPVPAPVASASRAGGCGGCATSRNEPPVTGSAALLVFALLVGRARRTRRPRA